MQEEVYSCCIVTQSVSGKWKKIFTDHFSGPGKAIGPACVCAFLSMTPEVTFEINDLWPIYLASSFILTFSVVKFEGSQGNGRSRAQELSNC